MRDIEIGEYVRTISGKIGIFDRYSSRPDKSPFNCFIKLKKRKTSIQCCREYITKHSKNIIDLIEVGDIVNRKQVTKIFIDPFTKKRRLEIEGIEVNWKGDMSLIYIGNEDIKSIVTHQQFKEMEYKL